VVSGPDDLSALEEALGHRFDDLGLLRRALSHRSWVAENGAAESNERLEFLGDAVLGWVIADFAYHRYADRAEGALTDLRKAVVNQRALAEVARSIGLGGHVYLGRGEEAAGGGDKDSILSDAFEAVLGAVYLDGGVEAARRLVATRVAPRLERALDGLHRLDRKSALQERLAADGREPPEYRSSATGPDHDKVFTAQVLSEGTLLGSGSGRSKKDAEQAAALDALDGLDG
jgi:ribonuclease-3